MVSLDKHRYVRIVGGGGRGGKKGEKRRRKCRDRSISMSNSGSDHEAYRNYLGGGRGGEKGKEKRGGGPQGGRDTVGFIHG